ncbi:MAG: DNA-binding protein [Candidatus Omnitrophota bacterium]|nr:DNA-binding protein [Candidatus Omnitrophota bacterium]
MRRFRSQKSEFRSQKSKIGLFFCLLSSVFCLLSSVCFAKPISSTQLIEHAKEYDNKTVSFQGEVIGDIMRRGNFAWVNINDFANAIGIWLKADLTKEISYAGSYKFRGDVVLVQGTFNRACPQHGGDLDIHANSLEIIGTGKAIAEKLDIDKYKASLGFLGVVLCFGILRLLRKKPRKK